MASAPCAEPAATHPSEALRRHGRAHFPWRAGRSNLVGILIRMRTSLFLAWGCCFARSASNSATSFGVFAPKAIGLFVRASTTPRDACLRGRTSTRPMGLPRDAGPNVSGAIVYEPTDPSTRTTGSLSGYLGSAGNGGGAAKVCFFRRLARTPTERLRHHPGSTFHWWATRCGTLKHTTRPIRRGSGQTRGAHGRGPRDV